jgi:hypothetical protein
MKCINHPEKDAVAMCVSCGVGLCADCRKREPGGATYCEECQRTHEPPKVYPGRAGNGFNIWSVSAWILAIVGWWPGLEFVSIAGILLGFVALGDMRLSNSQQGGRVYAYAAIACGAGGLIVKLALVGYMLYSGVIKSPFDAYKYVGL